MFIHTASAEQWIHVGHPIIIFTQAVFANSAKLPTHDNTHTHTFQSPLSQSVGSDTTTTKCSETETNMENVLRQLSLSIHCDSCDRVTLHTAVCQMEGWAAYITYQPLMVSRALQNILCCFCNTECQTWSLSVFGQFLNHSELNFLWLVISPNFVFLNKWKVADNHPELPLIVIIQCLSVFKEEKTP